MAAAQAFLVMIITEQEKYCPLTQPSHAFTANYKQTRSDYKNLIVHILIETTAILS
jgi:hypothetical protein